MFLLPREMVSEIQPIFLGIGSPPLSYDKSGGLIDFRETVRQFYRQAIRHLLMLRSFAQDAFTVQRGRRKKALKNVSVIKIAMAIMPAIWSV